jgi:multidrug efflux pump subunit AcrA (membrane-fusion protein)
MRRRSISRRGAGLYGALIAAIGIAGWFAYSTIYDSSSASASGVARTVTVARGTVESSVSASGNVSAGETRSPTFGTSGTLTSLTVSVGSKVTKGQVLGHISASDAKSALASATATLANDKQTLATALAGGTPAQRAQTASSLSSANLQLSSAEQTLAANQATLAAARQQLVVDQRLGCPAGASSSAASSGGGATTPSSASASPSSSSGAKTATTPSTTATTPSTSGGTRTTQAVAATSAPVASTAATSTVTTTAVTLTANINAGGAATTYVFQYGLKASYGSTTARASAGDGTTAATFDATIHGLKPATTYVYRVVAKNAKGTSSGLVQTFTTATPSCTTDRETIAGAQRTVSQQLLTVQQQEQSVVTAQANVDGAVDPSTVSKARAQVAQDQATVAADAKAVTETVLRAPISGTITAVDASVGDTVGGSSSSSSGGGAVTGGGASTNAASPGSGVVTIENLEKLEVVAGFAEADATKIKVGQPATVTLAALTSTTVAGKVTAVSPTSTVTNNVVTYDVTISLIDPPATVRDGMTADVAVVVARKANVLQLASAAITSTGPVSTVTVLAHGKQTTTVVTTGLVGASTTEVLTGVKEGDVVVEHTISVTASSSSSTPSNRTFGGGGFPAGGFGAGPP